MNKLVKKIPNIKYDFYGFANKQPIWGNDFNNALINSKMGLNLSRGKPTKYYSSNRIASLIGNGLLTFIDKKTISAKDLINSSLLKKLKLINKNSKKLKILGTGEIKEKINIKADLTSKSALKKLEKIGGSIQIKK